MASVALHATGVGNVFWQNEPRKINAYVREEYDVVFGCSFWVNISSGYSCDGLSIHFSLPSLPEGYRWVPYVGFALLKKVELVVGGMSQGYVTGELLYALTRLRTPHDKLEDILEEAGHRPELHTSWASKKSVEIMVDLDMCLNGMDATLCDFHSVTLQAVLTPFSELVQRRESLPELSPWYLGCYTMKYGKECWPPVDPRKPPHERSTF